MYADVGASNGTGSSDEPGLEFRGVIIDIEYTLPGYWLAGMDFETEPTDPSESEPIDPYKITEITGGSFIKSNRTSYPAYTIEYKFIDAERNTMKATFSDSENTGSGDVSQPVGTENSEVEVYIMKRLIDHEIKVNMDFLVIQGK